MYTGWERQTELLCALPEQWQCSLSEAGAKIEPGPELADIKRHEGQPEGEVEVGQF